MMYSDRSLRHFLSHQCIMMMRQQQLTCISTQHVLASRVQKHVLHQLELYAGWRLDHHPHGKHNQLAGRQSGGQEAPPVVVWQPEEGAEEVVGGLDVQLCQELHAKHVKSCLNVRQEDFQG